MSMLPGVSEGAGGDVEVQAAASRTANAQIDRFISSPPQGKLLLIVCGSGKQMQK
jgi:hypothetical protein